MKRARRQLTSPLLEQILSESSKPSQILEKIKGKERGNPGSLHCLNVSFNYITNMSCLARDASIASEVPLSAYTERFKEAWDPENGIEEEYWPDKDEMVCWRTMRAAMKGSVDHLDWAVKGTGALVKAVLGMETTDANKDTTDAAASTPRQSSSSGDAEVVKKEQESGREATKDSSGIKRKRSDSRGEA